MQNKLARTGTLEHENVVMANALTRSAQGLNLAEKRILFSAIAKMGNNFGEVYLYATEYAETFGLAPNQAYEQLKENVRNMRTRYFTLAPQDRTEATAVKKKGKKGMVWEINWFASIGYHDGDGMIGLEFSPKIIPYLHELEREFTRYKLKQACALRSVYSWRLLELFEQHTGNAGKGWWTVSVEDFCTAMEATNTHRKNFKDLRKKIIEPAINELVKKDGWLIGFEAVKEGRKVVRIRFDFERDPQGALF
jgi:plasmid replication initiation protein